MLASWVTAIVRLCIRFPWPIIALGIAVSVVSSFYSVRHFAITTDINKLISPDLDWRKREAEFEKAFPGHFGSTLVVVNAPTAEFAARASADLITRLKAEPRLFQSVDDIEGSEFFARNGLLFRPTEDVANFAKGLGQAAPLIGTLSSDPSRAIAPRGRRRSARTPAADTGSTGRSSDRPLRTRPRCTR